MEETRALAHEVCELSQTITDDQSIVVMQVLERVSEKWSLMVLYILAKSDSPLRFKDLLQQVNGISNKMLDKTLKLLVRDGLVVKQACKQQVPPKSEYQLSPLGRKLLHATTPLWKWVVSSIQQFEHARCKFKSKHTPKSGTI